MLAFPPCHTLLLSCLAMWTMNTCHCALDTSFREQLSRPVAPVLDAMPNMPTDVYLLR